MSSGVRRGGEPVPLGDLGARAVEITEARPRSRAFSSSTSAMTAWNSCFDGITLGNGGYVYLLGADGELIYHPQSQLI